MHSEQQGDPPEAEWNFSRCPKSEAGICWLYEHLRGLKQFGTLESNNERYLGAVLIAPADGRTRFLRQCEALWNIVVPENRNLPKRKRGLGSPFARSPSDLRKLSAWRLHRVYRMSVDDAIALLEARIVAEFSNIFCLENRTPGPGRPSPRLRLKEGVRK